MSENPVNTVYTDENKCVGCNSCILHCPVQFSNMAKVVNGQKKILVDSSRCIQCGRCIDVCSHGARKYIDDTERFFADLRAGKPISLICSPMIMINIPDYKRLFGYLKSQGVRLIMDNSLGRDINTWAYLKLFKGDQGKSYISSNCSAIVDYVEKYLPDLIDRLAPVQSSSVCTAIYLKKYRKLSESLAYISPCISKNLDSVDNEAEQYIQYNLTITKLADYLFENTISYIDFEECDYDNDPNHKDISISYSYKTGENLALQDNSIKIKQFEVIDGIYLYLKRYNSASKNKKELPDFVDCHNCSIKRFYDPEEGIFVDEEEAEESLLKLKNAYLEKANILCKSDIVISEYYDNNYNIEDFYRNFTDKSNIVRMREPSGRDYKIVFKNMHKMTQIEQNINCPSCGYKSCRKMAKAIYNGINLADNCINYLEHQKNEEKQELIEKNEEISLINDEVNLLLQEAMTVVREKENNEKKIRAVLDNLTVAVVVTDNLYNIQTCNQSLESVFKYEEVELIGAPISVLIPDYEFIFEELIEELGKKNNFDFIDSKVEINGMKKDGTFFPLEMGINEVSLEEEDSYIFVFRDISERKEVEKVKNAFISTVSHELRTPLTSIKGSIGLILGGILGDIPQKAVEMLVVANNNCARLISLINDMLDIEKINAGKMDFKMQEQEIMDAVYLSLDLNQNYAAAYGVSYKITKKLDKALINADKDRLLQVLANLLSNAAKFSPSGTDVKLEIERINGRIRVSVIDAGIGISGEHKDKIFQNFSQVDSSDSRAKGGTGLGLSLSKTLVEKMGGSIGFESELNKGSRFYFEFSEVCCKDSDDTTRVLICEDSHTVAKMLSVMLKKHGFECDIAHDTEQALNMLKNRRYDLMTLDVILPDKDGVTFVKELNMDAKLKELPIVIVSTKNKSEYAEIVNYPSVIDWISKPIDQTRLIDTIDAVISSAKMEKQINGEVHK